MLGRRNSGNVQKVMWAIGEVGVDYERRDVGGSFGYPSDYPNPTQVVPTIRDGELTLWESNACVRYIARTYGAGSLWPDDAKELALADQWMEWQRSDFGSAFFPVFQQLIKFDADPSTLADAVARLGAAYGQLDARLRTSDFVAGPTLTMGDIPVGALTYRYMTLPIDRPSTPNVDAWYARLCDSSAYQKHVMIPYGSNSAEWAEEEAKSAGVQ